MGKLDIRRLGYACGAEVVGLDLRKRLDDEIIAEIKSAWLEHLVLCFRKQTLAPEEQVAFCGRFGELDDQRNSVRNRHPDYPAVQILSNKPLEVNEKMIGGNRFNFWHSDHAYTPRVQMAGFLHALVLPDIGGDTMFANQQMAYESLSPKMQSIVASLEGIQERSAGVNRAVNKDERFIPPTAQRLVQVFPETGRKTLYLGGYMRFFKGMTPGESKPILDFLSQHATRYEFIYRHRWAVGDLIMWNNRALMHYGVLDYDMTQRRLMQRCALVGPKIGIPYEIEPALAS